MKIRRLFSLVHLYVGLVAALVLVVVSVTGSALVFLPEIEAWLYPDLMRVEPAGERVPLDRVVEAAREGVPAARPSLVSPPDAPNEVYHVYTALPDGGEGPEVFVDPYTAEVLGSRMPGQGITELIFDLHVKLLAGPTGEIVVGISGLVLLLLCVSGVVLWWPSRRRLVGLKVKWGARGKRVNYDLHRAGGMWTLPFLVVVATTGAGLVFYVAAGHALDWVTGSPPPPVPPVSVVRPGAEAVPLETAEAAAERLFPEGDISYITPPTTPEAPILVRLRLPGEMHPNGRSYIYLDQWSGEVLGVENALEAPLGPRILHSFYPLHIGRFAGPWMRWLYVLLGLSPAVLAVTGVVVWWGRKQRPVREKRAPAPSEDGVPPRVGTAGRRRSA